MTLSLLTISPNKIYSIDVKTPLILSNFNTKNDGTIFLCRNNTPVSRIQFSRYFNTDLRFVEGKLEIFMEGENDVNVVYFTMDK